MKEAMLEWGTDGYTVKDIEAWNLYARSNRRTLTGMNIFLSEKINASKAGEDWTKLIDCIISDITGSGCTVVINIASDKTGKLYIGESERAMVKEFEGVFDTDHYTFTINDLLPGKRYYLYIKNTKGM